MNSAVKVPVNQNEFDALASLGFNIGGGAPKGSTLLKKLNAGDRIGAANHFLVWDKITKGGKKVALPGLAARREAERRQFLRPVDQNGGCSQSDTPQPTDPQTSPAATPESKRSLLTIILDIVFNRKGA